MSDKQNKLMRELSEEICSIGTETIQGILTKSPTPNGLQTAAENAAAFAESATQQYADPSFKPACKTGCHWCCFQSVSVSGIEVFRIAKHIQSMPDDEQEALISGLRDLNKLTRGKSRHRRAKLKRPCAFLKDGLCSIYTVRPLACAEFTSSDVADCKKGFRKGFHVSFVTREKSRTVAYKAVQRGVFLGLVRAVPTADASLFELTSAILTAIDHPNSEFAWLKGEPIFSQSRINIAKSGTSKDTK